MANLDSVIARLKDRYGPGGPPLEPAAKSEVTSGEGRLGFGLPVSLRRVYMEVANGGIGPAFGIFGVGTTGYRDIEQMDLVDRYLDARDPRTPFSLEPDEREYSLWAEGWPEFVLPLTAPAGTLAFHLDAISGAILSSEGNDIQPGMAHAEWLQHEDSSLEGWLVRWLNGDELPYAPKGAWGGHPNQLPR